MGSLYTYTVHFPLPNALQERIDPWRKSLKKEMDVFSVPKLKPHITLMRMTCDEADEKQLCEDLKKVGKDTINIVGTGLEKVSRSSVAIKIEKTKELQELHTAIADVMAEYNAEKPQNVPIEYQDRFEEYKKYGSPFFGSYYKPHLTIGYTGGEFPKDITLPFDVSWEAKDFSVSKKKKQSGKPYRDVTTIQLS